MGLIDALATGNETVEVVADLVGSGHLALHPRVRLDLFQRNTFLRVVLGQTKDQVEELCVRLDVAVSHGANGISMKASIVGVIRLRESELGKFQDEENGSTGKDVNRRSVVRLFPAKELRGHVVRRTTASFEICAIGTGKCLLEAEVRYFHSAVLVQEAVFKLEVTMGNALLVDICNSFDQLDENLTGVFVIETSSSLNVVERLTICAELHNDVENIVLGFSIDLDCGSAGGVELNHVRMD